ncbi:MAG TPA: ATP-binding protein [Azospira sp.]|nr:ATP-binding protein [Azospira sp.]
MGFTTLSRRVLLLVVLATLPPLLFSFIVYWQSRTEAIQGMEANLRQLAKIALADERHVVNYTRQLLRIMANANDVQDLRGDDCNQLAQRLLATQSLYANFGAVTVNGQVVCSGHPAGQDVNIADRAWFREVLKTRQFSQGQYTTGRISGRPGVTFGYPLMEADGKLRGAVFAAVSLEWFHQLIAGMDVPPGWVITAFDQEGKILAREPDSLRWTGQTLHDTFRAAQARPGEIVIRDGLGVDGIQRLYAITPLTAGLENIYISIGAPQEKIMGDINRQFLLRFGLLLLVAASAALLGWSGIHRSVVLWAQRLGDAARRVGQGKLDVQAQAPSRLRELAELTETFNAMAANIAARAKQQEADARRIAELNRLYALLSGINRVIVATPTREELFLRICHVAKEAGGMQCAWIGEPNHRRQAIEVVASTWPVAPEPLDGTGPFAGALRSGELGICNDVRNLPASPWRDKLLAEGLLGAVGIPLRQSGEIMAVLALHTEQPGFFDREEIALLEELGRDISYALDALLARELQERASAELQRLNEQLEQRVTERTTALSLANARLTAYAAEVEDLYNHAPCGYHSVDANGVLQRINDTELGWLGYRREEIVGQLKVRDLLAPHCRPLFDATFPGFKATGQLRTLEVDFLRKDGSLLPVVLSATAVSGPDGSYLRSRSTLFDNTERQARERQIASLNRELEQRAARLEAANRDLEAFSYSVSHDLKAPLRAVAGFAQIIDRRYRQELPTEGQHYLDNIVVAAQRMGQLIEDLLHYSRLGRQAVRCEATPLAPLLARIQEKFSQTLEQYQAHLDIALPLATPLGNATLLEQILSNLIENAIIYQPAGQAPRLGVSSEREGDWVLLRVTDNGIGIPPEYREKVFEVFQRLHGEDTYPGTGIGLAIVRKSAQLMGGEVSLDSPVDGGSTFTLRLPAPPEGNAHD